MAKVKTAFFCQNCGAQHAKWMGQCTTCNEWNTLVEEIVQKEEKHKWNVTAEKSGPNKALAISQIQIQKEQRIGTQNQELRLRSWRRSCSWICSSSRWRTWNWKINAAFRDCSKNKTKSPLCLRRRKSISNKNESRTAGEAIVKLPDSHRNLYSEHL